MGPMRVRVHRVVDFGTVVSLVGLNDDTGDPVVVHVDQRPFEAFCDAWRLAGFEQPVEYEADKLVLNIDLGIDEALEPRAQMAGHE